MLALATQGIISSNSLLERRLAFERLNAHLIAIERAQDVANTSHFLNLVRQHCQEYRNDRTGPRVFDTERTMFAALEQMNVSLHTHTGICTSEAEISSQIAQLSDLEGRATRQLTTSASVRDHLKRLLAVRLQTIELCEQARRLMAETYIDAAVDRGELRRI